MLHCIREAWMPDAEPDCKGPVEVDEFYFGSKERNKYGNKCLHTGRSIVGTTAVMSLVDRTGTAYG